MSPNLGIQVADGNISQQNEYIVMEMAYGTHKEPVAFLLMDTLPVDVLLGRQTD